MVNYQLPRDGSILIIDDKVEEALPLIQLLSQKAIASTYYSAKSDRELPENPTQKIRLAFIDIQLFEAADPNTYAQNILRLLDRIIPKDNGPYILIVWSKLEDVFSNTLEAQVTSKTFDKRPITYLRLRKADYFESVTDESLNDLLEEAYSSLSTRFEKDDLDAIKGEISGRLVNPVWKAKRNALDLISNALQTKLKEAEAFHLFTIWENIINKSSGKIVYSFSTLYPSDKYWRDNLRSCIYRLAHAQLGKTIGSVPPNELIKNALKTLNYSFLDVVENELSNISDLSEIIKIDANALSLTRQLNGSEYRIKWTLSSDKYQIYIDNVLIPTGSKGYKEVDELPSKGRNPTEKANISTLVKSYKAITPEINNRLLIDINAPESLQPGNVYIKNVRYMARRKELLKNYFKDGSKLIDNNGNYIVSDKELKNIIFIELEVTPLCDYAQGKWLKSRFLPGILIPEGYAGEIKNPDSFYTQIPLLKINDVFYKPIFDFRLLKSHDINQSKEKLGEALFRIRRELCADILSRLSSHASRVGITYVE